MSPGQQQLGRDRVGDLAAQAHRRAAEREETAPGFCELKVVVSPATRMSIGCRISVPPAIAQPSTAAINGFVGRFWRSSAFQARSASLLMHCAARAD